MRKCGEHSMKKQHGKKHRIPLNIQLALLFFFSMLILVAAVDWGRIWTYHEYRNGNIVSQTGICIKIELSETLEMYDRYGGSAPIYAFTLDDGTRLGIYDDLAEEHFSTGWRIEALEFLKNRELTFTYIPKKIFTDGSYVLFSISNGSESILDEQHVVSYYRDWLRPALILSCIVDGIALLLVIVPPIYRLVARSKKQANKRRNKQKKLQKKLQVQQKRASQNQDDRKG